MSGKRAARVENVTLPASALVPHERNYNRHSDAQINDLRESLRQFGQVRSIVVQPRGKKFVIVAGHGIAQAAQAEGLTQLRADVIPAAWSQTRVLAYLAADNELARHGDPDQDQLAAIVREVMESEGEALARLAAGEQAALDALLAQANKQEENADVGALVDKAAELQKKWNVRRGDIWEIGKHRLMCGDSSNADDVQKLLNGARAKLTVTSPPYGVGKSYETKGIAPWYETVRPAIRLICKHSDICVYNIGDLYSTGGQYIEPTFSYSVNMFAESGFKPIWIRIWLKQGINFGVGAYHLVSNKPAQQYEYIGAFGADDAIPQEQLPDMEDFEWLMAFANANYKFVKRLSQAERKEWAYAGVWKINTVTANKEHPAMFPIELPSRAIKMHTDIDDFVYEPFNGSGTTLAACQLLGRIGRGMELDPKFAAVALERLSLLGLTPKRLEHGKQEKTVKVASKQATRQAKSRQSAPAPAA